jgi:hypothetical protein
VDDIQTAYGAVREPAEETRDQYSPGDFLRRFASVIAICLGLALLAHVLMAMAGG